VTATLEAARPDPRTTPIVPLRRQRAFVTLWFGEGVSVLGGATSSILIPLLAVLDLHATAWWMGLLTAAAWVPWLLIGLPAGAMVDQLSPRAVMIAADVVSAVSLVTVPIAWWTGVLTLAQLFAVALINGTCSVFFRAAYPALVNRVVAPEELTEANARMFGTESASNVVGQGVGGWLAGAFGAATGVLLDAVSFVVSAACLWRIRLRPDPRERQASVPIVERVKDGLRFVYSDGLLRLFTVLGGVSNFGLTGYQAVLVLYLVNDGGLTSTQIGVLFAIDGAGGLVGAAVAAPAARRFGTARAMVWFGLASGVPTLLLGLVQPGWSVLFAAVALPAVGFGVVAGNVIKGGWRMRYVPSELQARAVTATQIVNFGTMPLAALCAGWLGSTIGLRATVVIMVAVHVTTTLAILASPVARQRDLPGLARSAP
jgi:predicted MFS family arabinose efflux permease